MQDPEDCGLAPLPGDTHTVPTENLTIEEAKAELDDFVQKISPGSMTGEADCAFAMDENTVVETSPPGPLPSMEEVRRRAAKAAEQAAIETGEIPDIRYSVEDAIRLIRAKMSGLQAALGILEAALYPQPLPNVLEESVVD
jgi:hypothetical protein